MAQILLLILHNILTLLKQVISTSKARLDSNSTEHFVDRRIKSIKELNNIVKVAYCILEVEDIIIKVDIHNSNIHFLRSPFSLIYYSLLSSTFSLTQLIDITQFLISNIFSFYLLLHSNFHLFLKHNYKFFMFQN